MPREASLIGDELQWAESRLRQAGVDTSRLDAETLLAHVTGLSRTGIIAHSRNRLPEEARSRFRALVEKRAGRYPLPYLVGTWEFYGLPFEVNPSVLIPRPETETLVEACVSWLGNRRAVIAEIGVGSGAVAVALAKELRQAKVYGTEISPDAAETAARNARRHSVQDRVKVLVGDLAKPLFQQGLSGRVDALVSNPPYIASGTAEGLQPEVLREPALATIAGADALRFYRSILADAPALLAAGGGVFLEIDPGLAGDVAGIGERHGLRLVETVRDLAGLERVVVLECASSK